MNYRHLWALGAGLLIGALLGLSMQQRLRTSLNVLTSRTTPSTIDDVESNRDPAIVHLRIAILDGHQNLVLRREEWEELDPMSPLPLGVARSSIASIPVKFRWIFTTPTGRLQQQWWSAHTYQSWMRCDITARLCDTFRTFTTLPHGLLSIHQPVSEFAIPVPQNPELRDLLSKSRQTLAETTINRERAIVVRTSMRGSHGIVINTYYISKTTHRLLREIMMTAPTGLPIMTRIFILERYEILDPRSVPAAVFDPPIPAGVTRTHH